MNRLSILPVLFLLTGTAFSQTPRAEIGVQVSGLRENALGEYPVGGGGRITVHAFRFVDGEVEVDRYPIGGGKALFPGTQVTFGTRVGKRFGPIGVYAKVAPGFVRFDTNAYVPTLGTQAALYYGGLVEFYSRHHFAARFDLGDAIVWYGGNTVIPAISGPGTQVVAGTRHQAQWSLGLSAWF